MLFCWLLSFLESTNIKGEMASFEINTMGNLELKHASTILVLLSIFKDPTN